MTDARPVALAAAAAILAAALWAVLSVATGLIFHLMPAAPVLATTLGFRLATGDARAPWPTAVTLAAIGIVAAVGGTVLVRAFGGSLDQPALLVGAIGGGIALSLFLARRSEPITSRRHRPADRADDQRGGQA